MRSLLDVNVLIALLDENHTFHQLAHQWFAEYGGYGWASCPITENGVVRIMAGAKYNRARRLSVQDVTEALTGLIRTNHQFWADDISVRDGVRISADLIHSSGQLTDAYLLALAVKNKGRFVTLDQRVPLVSVPSARHENLMTLVDM